MLKMILDGYHFIMAPPPKIRHFLSKLDAIETAARRRFPQCSFLFLYNVSYEFVVYYRYLVAMHPDLLQGPALDALQFYFDKKLEDIFRSKGDFDYLAYEIDGQSVWPVDHIIGRYSGWV